MSYATNLVALDTNAHSDVFVKDLQLGATTLGSRFVVLCVRVVSKGSAIPVVGKVLPALAKEAWQPHWLTLVEQFHGVLPEHDTVVAFTDRGLGARWLLEAIVATSADEMGKSVAEIAHQVAQSAAIASDAVHRARTTGETMEQLSRSAEKIGRAGERYILAGHWLSVAELAEIACPMAGR